MIRDVSKIVKAMQCATENKMSDNCKLPSDNCEYCSCVRNDNGEEHYICDHKKVMEDVSEEMGKRVKKKPRAIEREHLRYYRMETHICPTCSQQVFNLQLFCDACGQAMLWISGQNF